MGKTIILTAAHHNWGLQCKDDWHKTFYILYDNGDLRSVIYEGAEIREENYRISDGDREFIRENIEYYIRIADEIDASDGDAWEFEAGGYTFDLGYIYDSELEKIAEILLKASN